MGILHIGEYCRFLHFKATCKNLIPRIETMLDAGCGQGWYSAYVAKVNPTAHVEAIDLDDSQIQRANWLFSTINNLTFTKLDINKLQALNKYDLICCIDVLEHVQRDDLILKKLHALVKALGYVYIHVPVNSPRRYFPSLVPGEQSYHVRPGYSNKRIKKLLEAAGFAVCAIKPTFGPFGSLAWEIDQVVERMPQLIRLGLKLTVTQLLKMLAWADVLSHPIRGNGILILATKK